MKHAASLLLFGICLVGAAGADALPQWRGDALAGWAKRTHQCAEARTANGALRVTCGGTDAHVYSPAFDLPAKSAHVVSFKARGGRSGTGELFWMKPGEGARQEWSARFEWIGDGEWHEYRVRPYWQGEGRIGQLRLDFPNSASDGGVFEVSELAIEDVGEGRVFEAEGYAGVAFSLASSSNGLGEVRWASSEKSGLQSAVFRVPGDGRRHRFFVDMSDRPHWAGTISLLEVVPPSGAAKPEDFAPVADAPDFPADLFVRSAWASDAVNRVGTPTPVTVLLNNIGTRPAENVRLTATLPKGARLLNEKELSGRTIAGLDGATFTPMLECSRAGTYVVAFTAQADGVAPATATATVTVTPALGLPKASYVPEPRPVETDYDIAALYFPGWNRAEAWRRVWNVCPERKPVLGWYDEANPEVVDWQIKWLVENGIRTLYVDWYWSRGSQSLDHWVKAFQKARYRSHLKWAMMWANHNAPGSHSVEDQRKVTRFWMENYFNTPEYLRIDGKPVVWIWSAQGMERDAKKDGGCRRLLEVSREMAREAGFKGIHFIAMKWPEADCRPQTIQVYKDMGFDMTGIYHFMDPGAYEPRGRRFSYSSVARANPENWRAQHKAGVLPFLPNLSTGWDDRPWNDHCEIYGKNVADFRRICEEAKRFADETGVRRLCLAPLNEWGEGSYAEPNAEHGFGFYEAVRDVFCKKPADGWPANVAPKDVGLGPYDLPPPKPPRHVTEWSFTGGDAQEWHPMMGVNGFAAGGEGLAFRTVSRDPAICATFLPFAAGDFTKVVVRMKASGGGETAAQLFWSGPQTHVRESASVSWKVAADGAFRDVEFPVSGCRAWRGRVNHFRFDPTTRPDMDVVVQSIRLVK